MNKIYKKKELNLDNNIVREQIEVLTNKDKNYVDAKVIAESKEDIKLEYKIDGIKSLNELKKSFHTTKLRVILNVINLYKNKNIYLESDINIDNIYYTDDLNVCFLERKILDFDDIKKEEEVTMELKRLVGSLFLKDTDNIKHADDKILSKHEISKKMISANNIQEIENIIVELIEELEKRYINEETIVKKNLVKKNKKFKQVNYFIYGILIIIILYIGVYQLPFILREIKIVNNYETQNYSEVINILDKTNVNRMNDTVLYYSAMSVIKVENLSDLQKENIVGQLSVTTETNVLKYWVQLGQNDFDGAYASAVTLKNYDMQEYAILKKMDLLELNENISGDDKKTQMDTLQGQIDELESKKHESVS